MRFQLAPMPLKTLLPEWDLPAEVGAIAVQGLSLDSRSVRPGWLFVGLSGSRARGQDFACQALAAGACAVLLEAEGFAVQQADRPVISLPDLSHKVSEIAARFYGLPGQELRIIGVTGTNGKTTCTQLLASLYLALGERSSVLGTLGYRCLNGPLVDTGMTTPDAIRLQAILRELREGHARHLAMEVSSHALEQGRIAAVPIQTAVFTNLTRDHLDYHGTMDAYGAAKLKLFHQLGIQRGIVNRDDDFADQILASSGELPMITYGLDARAQVRAENIYYHSAGIEADLVTPWGRGELRSNLLGEFNLSNLLAVIAAACAEGFPLAQVLAALPTLAPVSGRMELVDKSADAQVVVDYAHTPDALRAVLQAARLHCSGKLWCLFGCGGDRDSGKRPQMAAVAESLADGVWVTSDNPRTEDPVVIIDQILAGFADQAAVRAEADRRAAIASAVAHLQAGDWLVIAGKGHEDYQIIGTEKLPFSDQQEARAALRRRGVAP